MLLMQIANAGHGFFLSSTRDLEGMLGGSLGLQLSCSALQETGIR
jgi:hypothetical protein